MRFSQLTQQILHLNPCVPSFSQTLAEKVVIGTSTFTSNSTLQELAYTDDAVILQFQISLGIEHLVLHITKDSAEILHKVSKFDQMLRISKQHGSNFTGCQHPENNNCEIK